MFSDNIFPISHRVWEFFEKCRKTKEKASVHIRLSTSWMHSIFLAYSENLICFFSFMWCNTVTRKVHGKQHGYLYVITFKKSPKLKIHVVDFANSEKSHEPLIFVFQENLIKMSFNVSVGLSDLVVM